MLEHCTTALPVPVFTVLLTLGVFRVSVDFINMIVKETPSSTDSVETDTGASG